MQTDPYIALVAGEASGDQLGASLIGALRELRPGARFAGVGGPLMTAAGMECWWDSDELAVMGLFEVVSHLPRLLRFRRRLYRRLLAESPDILVGIDSPDFNLGLEKRVRKEGIRAVHYVSPTVWAWREGRVKGISKSTDMVLCLFPFEPDCYRGHEVSAYYTGHPMADAIAPCDDRAATRTALSLPADGPCIALLPGSRRAEAGRLAEPLIGAAAELARRYPRATFVAPMAGPGVRAIFEAGLASEPGLRCTVLDGQAREAMAAADVVLTASGTATLEAMLINRPMVVAYRVSEPTFYLNKWLRLLKSPYFSLPNILAGERLVPELLQHEVTPRRLADEVSAWLEDAGRRAALADRFTAMRGELRCDAASSAARCIDELLQGN
ncbi:MAG: lipid-A-disaccharide synthase [Xanthomonadales bacterium]|nr:lipid-A-disaccharide synthase [Xanthomonadales bacterium]NIX11755.1 lipid-A-disaccharide synthase [Xanthomonadales bacterium]